MEKVIMVVEDDPSNMKLFKDILQISGYKTLEADNNQKGVNLARENIPDLILMDIQLPVMDGLEAAKKLKADPATRNIPVIALTAYAMKGDEDNFGKAGFDGYIAKPLDVKEFLKVVEEYLNP